MQLETTKIIDRYLAGELSASEHQSFEEQLKFNEGLRNELELQHTIQEAAIRASFRVDVQRAARRYRLNRIIKWGATGLGIVAVIVATSFWISTSTKKVEQQNFAPTIALSMMEKLSSNADFGQLPIQYFSVPKNGDVFLSDQSVMLSIPAKAFLLNNKVYLGDAIVQFQEAIKANEIVKAGLNTMSGGNLLETQGMFSIHAYTPDGTKLEINPTVGVYIQIPVDEHKSGMKLYDFVKLADGTTDWVNPRDLSKIPVPIDMKDLDFYPEGFEAELDNLKWKKQKSKRDSLYLSFENYCALEDEKSTNFGFQSDHTVVNTLTKKDTRKPINTKSMIVPFPAIDASYPGGGAAMKKFISKNCIYPESALKKRASGRVYVDFEVDEYGFISNEKVVRSVESSLDAEALRIVRAMPRWYPAETNGQKVRTKVKIPIEFSLNDTKIKEKRAEKPGLELMLGDLDNVKDQPMEMAKATRLIEIEILPQDNAPKALFHSDTTVLEDTPCNFPHISPSKVLAFWKPQFNNTNLSTREFERRMKAIHATCNDAVLKKYTSQLSKPISEIDRDVVNMGYSDFGLFAEEQVGAVNPNNPHLENLKAFYQKGVSSLQEQAKNDKNWEQQLRNKWDQHLTDLRTEHTVSTKNQSEKSTKDEVAYNQKRTVQKLGMSNQERMNPVAVYPQFGATIGFTARQSGGYNCDRAVVNRVIAYQAAIRSNKSPEAIQNGKINRLRVDEAVENGTSKRETFSVTANGKTRTVAYNSLSFGVSNPEKYDKILAYAFPHQLESYQLLDGENGNFSASLNDDIIYDICIVGISDKGYAYFQKQSLKGGNLGMIELERIIESKLDASLLQLNSKRISKPASMDLDLTWIKAEKKNFKEINRRKDMKEFREKLVEVIYPCYEAKTSEEITITEVKTFK